MPWQWVARTQGSRFDGEAASRIEAARGNRARYRLEVGIRNRKPENHGGYEFRKQATR